MKNQSYSYSERICTLVFNEVATHKVHACEPAGTRRLSNHTNAEHSFVGSVCKSFVKLGHHNWYRLLGPKGNKRKVCFPRTQ